MQFCSPDRQENTKSIRHIGKPYRLKTVEDKMTKAYKSIENMICSCGALALPYWLGYVIHPRLGYSISQHMTEVLYKSADFESRSKFSSTPKLNSLPFPSLKVSWSGKGYSNHLIHQDFLGGPATHWCQDVWSKSAAAEPTHPPGPAQVGQAMKTTKYLYIILYFKCR